MDNDRTALIGRVLPQFTYAIDDEDVRNYLRVTAEDLAAYRDAESARAAGYERRILPPSYAPWIALSALLRSIDWERDFYLDYRTGTSMFGEQEMIYARPLYAGEALVFTSRVLDVIEKHGARAFDLVTIAYDATDDQGAIALRGACGFILFK
jgi:acyl dehydratase